MMPPKRSSRVSVAKGIVDGCRKAVTDGSSIRVLGNEIAFARMDRRISTREGFSMLRSTLAFVVAVAFTQVALGQGISKFKQPLVPKKPSVESPFETQSRDTDAGPKLKMSSFRSVANSPYLIATIEHEDSNSFS